MYDIYAQDKTAVHTTFEPKTSQLAHHIKNILISKCIVPNLNRVKNIIIVKYALIIPANVLQIIL